MSNLPSGLLIFIFALAVAIFPHFSVLRRYEKIKGPAGPGPSRTFESFEMAWVIVNCLGYILAAVANPAWSDSRLALMTILLASLVSPTALYAGLTGVYPERTSHGHFYYTQIKDSATQLLKQYGPQAELRFTGWAQFALLASAATLAMRSLP